MLDFKKDRQDAAYWKLSMQLYAALAESYGIDPALVKRCWRENRQDNYESIGRYQIFGETDDVVHFVVYPKRLKKEWLSKALNVPTLFPNDGFVRFLATHYNKTRDVVVMSVIGTTPWFWTAGGSKRVLAGTPRILIPIIGGSPIIGSTFAVFKQENTP